MTATILEGNVLETLRSVPKGSCRTCVTSPPYYGLRDYGVEGQIGLEPTPELYVEKMVQVFRLVWDALSDDGTLWLNLGDSYWGGKGKSGQAWSTEHLDRDTLQKKQHQISGHGETRPTDGKHTVIKPKDLIGIPWMVAFALRADGWYLRQDIIWHKPNPMPESVKDRCTKAHEYIFLLSKSQKYYYDYEAVKEPATEKDWETRLQRESNKSFSTDEKNGIRTKIKFGGNTGEQTGNRTYSGNEYVYSGKRNRRDVWTVTTKPYKGAHFATFPPDLIEPCILAGSAVGDTVLDPFNGSGTTGQVALTHRRNYIGCELNPEYIELTNERLARIQQSFV